jgi:hypothetical protein
MSHGRQRPWQNYSETSSSSSTNKQASTKIYITMWDEELAETEKVIKQPKDLPDGLPTKNRKHYAN